MSLTRNGHRLAHHYYPRDDYHKFEFYVLTTDLDEMKDLYAARPALALETHDELLQRIEDVNKPFRRDNT